MRVTITSRIFAPEVAAASFRLAALARAFVRAGHDVEVLTVRPPKGAAEDSGAAPSYRVRRFPVLRDRTGYVRGYVQYLSFDVPLFFRVLVGRGSDLIVTEPPPTTGFFVRLAAGLRRVPYAYYAADVWSDATESTGAGKLVVAAVRAMERFALSGARAVLAVNDGVAARVREIAPRARVHTIGNGVDTTVFSPEPAEEGAGVPAPGAPYFIYSGTASEWQGAGIFVEAFAQVLAERPEARLVFLGQGSDWPVLQQHAATLPPGAVVFEPTVPADQAADWIRRAVASLASIRPDAGYSFAFPTKVFASWASGTPVIYAGPGPVHDFLSAHAADASAAGAQLGEACTYDAQAVVGALLRAFENEPDRSTRRSTGSWAARNVGLDAVAQRAVAAVTEAEGDG